MEYGLIGVLVLLGIAAAVVVSVRKSEPEAKRATGPQPSSSSASAPARHVSVIEPKAPAAPVADAPVAVEGTPAVVETAAVDEHELATDEVSNETVIEFDELDEEIPDFVPDDLVEEAAAAAAESAAPVEVVAEPVADAPKPLAKRTRKERSPDAAGGGSLSTSGASARSAQSKKSPEEVRAMLSKYRGGLEKGRQP